MAGVLVFLDADGNGQFDENTEEFRITSAAGGYEFASLPPGDFEVRIEIAGSLAQTLPAGDGAQQIELEGGDLFTSVNFGVVNTEGSDFGDLDGFAEASHRLVPGVFLGASDPDGEVGTQFSANAMGDNFDGFNDEDGVVANLGSDDLISPNEDFELTFTVSGIGGFLNGWIDFNGDGVFSESERVFDDVALDPGVHSTLDGILPSLTAPGTTTTDTGIAARFRWGPEIDDEGAPDPNAFAGELIGGEVEDYLYSSEGFAVVIAPTPNPALTEFQDNFGQTGPNVADLNNDNIVNAADFVLLRDTLAAGSGSAVAAAAPPAAVSTAAVIEQPSIDPLPSNSTLVEAFALPFVLVEEAASFSTTDTVASSTTPASTNGVDLALELLNEAPQDDEEQLIIDTLTLDSSEREEALALALEEELQVI